MGWAAGTASIIGLIAGGSGGLFTWLGKKFREKAEAERLRARNDALANVRRSIHLSYDDIEKQIADAITDMAHETMQQVISVPLREAVALYTLMHAITAVQQQIATTLRMLPRSVNPMSLVWETATALQTAHFPETTNPAVLHWLGEDWVTDAQGLLGEEGESVAIRSRAYDPGIFRAFFEHIGALFSRLSDPLPMGSGVEWLQACETQCREDHETIALLSELKVLADDGRASIFLIGDYNTGKTSFIKRLFVEAGLPSPATLAVHGNPTTNQVQMYEWDGLRFGRLPRVSEYAYRS